MGISGRTLGTLLLSNLVKSILCLFTQHLNKVLLLKKISRLHTVVINSPCELLVFSIMILPLWIVVLTILTSHSLSMYVFKTFYIYYNVDSLHFFFFFISKLNNFDSRHWNCNYFTEIWIHLVYILEILWNT